MHAQCKCVCTLLWETNLLCFEDAKERSKLGAYASWSLSQIEQPWAVLLLWVKVNLEPSQANRLHRNCTDLSQSVCSGWIKEQHSLVC